MVRLPLVILLCCAAFLLAPPWAEAHERSVSYSSWRIEPDGAAVELRLTPLDLTRLPLAAAAGTPDPGTQGSTDAAIADYVTGHLRLLQSGTPCPPHSAVERRASPAGWQVYAWHVKCPDDGAVRIESDLFAREAPSHLHFARVALSNGEVFEKVLSIADPEMTLADTKETAASAAGTTFVGYVALGIEHILSGFDHIAFVVGLLLLATTVREVAALVTSFTLAHSITLAVAVLGWVRPEAAAVEALIGFSIALLAAENAWLLSGRDRAIPAAILGLLAVLALAALRGVGGLSPFALAGLALFSMCHFGLLRDAAHPERLRAALAFAFGLIHGFGFAGILGALDLPPNRLVPALLGFNLGVEVGQLAVVLLLWPALRALSRLRGGRLAQPIGEIGSAAILSLGLFWFLTRTLAG